MSLLTDNAIRAIQARTQTTVRGFPYPATQQPLRKGRAIAEAQQTRALEAVAEWGAETCTKDELHLTGDKLQERNRMDCPLCMANLWEAVSEGKMPREE